MITPSFSLTAPERVLPRLALDFTTASLDPRVTFTRTTGASNPATYIDSSGVITAATNNQPRFDYDPVTLVCKGLLIEESRTNSLLNSDTLSTQSVTVTAAARTLSFYGTGQVVLSGAHSATVTGTGAYPTRTTLTFTPSAGTLTLTVTGTVQFAQLEAGAFATSYIPTTSAALTRNADVATMTGTNFSDWFNASEGTFAIQASSSLSITNSYAAFVNDSGTSIANALLMRLRSDSTANFTVRSGGADQAFISSSGVVANAVQNFTSAYKLNSFASCRAGGSVGTDALGNLPVAPAQMSLGSLSGSASSFLNGHLQKLAYYPQRLTNAEVQAFSK